MKRRVDASLVLGEPSQPPSSQTLPPRDTARAAPRGVLLLIYQTILQRQAAAIAAKYIAADDQLSRKYHVTHEGSVFTCCRAP